MTLPTCTPPALGVTPIPSVLPPVGSVDKGNPSLEQQQQEEKESGSILEQKEKREEKITRS